MAQIDVRRLYSDGTTPTGEQIDAIVDDVETFTNLTKLNDDNIPDDAITTAKIIDGTVTTAKIANDNITTAKILDAAVTTAKFASGAVTTAKIAAGAITTAKIADSNITTAKIANGSVTQKDVLTNSGYSSYTVSITSSGDYTVYSSSIYTTGKPILLEVFGSVRAEENSSSSTKAPGFIVKLYKNGVLYATSRVGYDAYDLSTSNPINNIVIPMNGIQFIVFATSGTSPQYTLKITPYDTKFNYYGNLVVRMGELF